MITVIEYQRALERAFKEVTTRHSTWIPSKDKTANAPVPVINSSQDIIKLRYIMTANTRDTLLRRNNNVAKIMGKAAGQSINKRDSVKGNKAIVQAAFDQAQEDFGTHPERYIEISPTSPDPVIRERYRLFPYDTKKDIQAIWGENKMYIKKDLYNITLGYRKFSISQMFDKNHEDKNRFEKFFTVLLMNYVPVWTPKGFKPLGEKAAVRILQAEDTVQELVKIVKDIWIIKNLFTLLGNTLSNISTLMLRGVPLKAILKDTLDSYNLTKEFQDQTTELHDLRLNLELGVITGAAIDKANQDINLLEQSLESNPIRSLMDSGMYQTLVEDITTDDTEYSYLSRLDNFVKVKTSKVPKGIKGAVDVVLLRHSTSAYKLLNKLTIMSDFSARYVLHKHLTQGKQVPIPEQLALRITRAAFVNYDVPTNRGLQYANDIGILPFTKYYIRIQAVLMEIFRNNPTKTLELLLLEQALGDMPLVLDSSMLNDIVPGNLSNSFLELPGAIDEILTIKAALKLI